MRTYRLSEIPGKVHGRTSDCLTPLSLFWSASGVELNVRAEELWMTFLSDYASYEPWICIEINGAFVSRMMLPKGEQRICIFRMMNPEKVKNVRIYKDVQAMNGDPLHLLQILSVETDGDFLPVEDKKIRIEFIGDSITSGEGLYGAGNEEEWISMFFGASINYAVMTAKALDAEYRLISQSGWGTYCGWDNDPHAALPDYYEKVCGLATGKRNEALGAQEENDFCKWQPDAVVIHLGTNDDGAFHSPAWTDPQTGELWKLHLSADDSYEPQDLERVLDAQIKMLYKIRKYNPKAWLVWSYGMLGQKMAPALMEGVRRYREMSGDERAVFVLLPDTDADSFGSRWHPGVASHRQAAQVLTQKLCSLLSIEK